MAAFAAPVTPLRLAGRAPLPLGQRTARPARPRAPAPTARFRPFGWRQRDEVVDVRARAAAGVPAIRVRGLRKAFSSRARKGSRAERARQIVAVDGVSFEVRAGQVFGLLGPNSSGKTSTLRCVGTLSRPDEGSVEVYGVDCVKDGVMVRGMMSYVAQSAGLDKVLTGREHLELFGALAHLGRDVLRRNIDQLVELLDLGDFIDRQTKVYSGGVARRLDMAIALMQQPVVLVLDEPTVGLDTASRTAIWRILRRLRDNGVAILLTSHYLEEVEMLADSVAIMDKGVIIAEGRVADLKAALGGDRVTVRIQEFTDGDTAEAAAAACVAAGVARSAVVNRLRANALELVVDDADSRAGAKVVEVLAAAGHPSLFSFTQARPSLDDVYVAATGKRLEDADREAKGLRDAKAERKENML